MPIKKKSYFFILSACLFVCGWGCAEKKTASASIAAPNFSLTDIAGNKFSLAELKGNVILLDFWATWCGPCVMSAPVVEDLVKTYQGKPVQIISISLDQDEAPVKDFVASHHLVNRVALDKDGVVGNRYSVSGIPAFYLIDKNGNVVNRWVGFAPELKNVWKSEIDRLLAK